MSPGAIRETAMLGVQDEGVRLPHLDRIQRSFGRYDITRVRAHAGAAASRAAQAIHASAYTVGGDVAFDDQPSLFTVAHEAAHVVQQRAGVQPEGGVSRAGDRFERHANAVAAHVVGGNSAEHLLAQISPLSKRTTGASQPAVQREEVQKAKTGIKDAALGAEVATTINTGLAKVDESLLQGKRQIRLAIRDDAGFELAWNEYADRSGTPGARLEAGLNGFVDPTHPNGKTGFVRASAGMGTAIHEAMHQRADSNFTGATVSRAVNEGTTELFTRVVIAYGGGNIERNVYEKEKTAMLRLQGISGLTALAQWYFKGDRSAVEKALGAKLSGFMERMAAEDTEGAVGLL